MVICPFSIYISKYFYEVSTLYKYIEDATKNLTIDELTVFAKELKDRQKNELVAYFLWFVGHPIGLHRFYLGSKKAAIIMLVLGVLTLGLSSIITFFDVFSIQRLLVKSKKKLVLEIIKEVKNHVF